MYKSTIDEHRVVEIGEIIARDPHTRAKLFDFITNHSDDAQVVDGLLIWQCMPCKLAEPEFKWAKQLACNTRSNELRRAALECLASHGKSDAYRLTRMAIKLGDRWSGIANILSIGIHKQSKTDVLLNIKSLSSMIDNVDIWNTSFGSECLISLIDLCKTIQVYKK